MDVVVTKKSRVICQNKGDRRSMALMVVDNATAKRGLGAKFRHSQAGPERDLLDAFLQDIPLSVPTGCAVTVFREPRIESGYPDLVIVVWKESVTRSWNSVREELSLLDLRILHYIHQVETATRESVGARFGQESKYSIERLCVSGLIKSSSMRLMPYSLRRCFAAKKIIAVEAKIDKWADVLNQAVLNTWFASRSYVLVPRRPADTQMEAAKALGIGVCYGEAGGISEVESECSGLPRSYASWAFNEWAWRSAQD